VTANAVAERKFQYAYELLAFDKGGLLIDTKIDFY
jgi:hypothetical protein